MKLNSKQLQHSYNNLHLQYSLAFNREDYPHFIKVLRPRLGSKSLDVACGKGFLLAELGMGSTGVDFSETALKIARANSPESSLVLADGTKLPLKNESFDYVCSIGSLEHFLEPEEALKEMARVTKPEGKLLIVVPNGFWLRDLLVVLRKGRKPLQEPQEYAAMLSRVGWENLITSAGLRIENAFKYNGRPKVHLNLAKSFSALLQLLTPLNLSWCFIFICSKG